jgi:methionine-rich copper-binding protein CopC
MPITLEKKPRGRGKHDTQDDGASRRTESAIGYIMISSFIRSAPASDHGPSLRAGQAKQAVQAPRMMLRRLSVSRASAEPAVHSSAPRRNAARTRAALLCLPAAAFALGPANAPAHAIIVAAQPTMNSIVAPGEIAIRLDFNSRVDSKRSGLVLQRPDRTEVAVALTPGSPPGVLAGHVQVKESGRWKLHWQVLSLDGHITRGEVVFSVRDAAGAR